MRNSSTLKLRSANRTAPNTLLAERFKWSRRFRVPVASGCGVGIALVVWACLAPGLSEACPFCPPASKTLNELLSQSDYAALAQFVASVKPQGDDRGQSEFEIVRLEQNANQTFAVKQRVKIPRYVNGEPGELYLLTGAADDVVLWDEPLAISETAFNYVVQSPSAELPWKDRLEYYMRFLEFPDEQIATDAFTEVSKAPYEAVRDASGQLPVEKLRRWVFEKEAIPVRHGLYGMLLGLCGDESDAVRLRAVIEEEGADFRFGVDGMMGGYMLLLGEPALEVIEQSKLQNPDAAFAEVYSAMNALRFMWTYGDGRISRDRLRQAMRGLLERPKLTELVVRDLARWEDWKALELLQKIYSDPDRSDRYGRREIIIFAILCQQAGTKESAAADTKLAGVKAAKWLGQVEQDDPKLLEAARRQLEFQ